MDGLEVITVWMILDMLDGTILEEQSIYGVTALNWDMVNALQILHIFGSIWHNMFKIWLKLQMDLDSIIHIQHLFMSASTCYKLRDLRIQISLLWLSFLQTLDFLTPCSARNLIWMDLWGSYKIDMMQNLWENIFISYLAS